MKRACSCDEARNISYSIVPFGTVQMFFLTAQPLENHLCSGDDTQGHGRTVQDWPRQIRDVLYSIRQALDQTGFRHGVLMSTFFLADIGKKELVRTIIAEVFSEYLGATAFVPQTPADGFALVAEIWAYSSVENDLTGKDCHCLNFCSPGHIRVEEFDSMRWLFAGDMRAGKFPTGAYARSYNAFEKLGEQLRESYMDVDLLVRTWIYQGHLVLSESTSSGKTTQRYLELNRARTDFFEGIRFLDRYLPAGYKGDVYPASTGIGTDDVDIVISGLAIDTDRKDFMVVPLENPNQTPAFDYAATYSPQSPKFSRAMAIVPGNYCMVLVSGTAGITASESRHTGDAVGQTELTLDNIAALIDGDNLRRHGIPDFASNLSNLRCARGYIKRPEDVDAVRSICQRRLGDTPVLYTIADVCRPELLVEIEGIAVAEK